MKIKQIIKSLEIKFPKRKAEKWDKVGLIFGNKRQKIQKIVISLDLTKKVLDYAIDNQANLIITHHPFLFYETIEEDYAKAPYKKNLVKRIQNMNICVYAMHTNFDSAPNGMSKILVKKLGFKKYSSIPKTKYGKIIQTSLSPKLLKKLFKEKLNFKIVYSNIKEKIVYSKIAIFPGSGSIEDIIKAKKEGAGLIITSDIKWSDWITAEEMNIKLMQISHAVENVFIDYIKKFLKRKNKNLEILSIASKEIVNL